MAAIAVSGIRQDLRRMLSSSLDSALYQATVAGVERAVRPGSRHRNKPVARIGGPKARYSIGLDSDTLIEIASAQEASARWRSRDGMER
jgi:hypothetical protein